MSTKTINFVVSGRVQGVGYRAFVARLASKYKLNGFAENLFDGKVNIMLNCTQDLIEEIYIHLKKGPALSFVSQVSMNIVEDEKFNSFYIK